MSLLALQHATADHEVTADTDQTTTASTTMLNGIFARDAQTVIAASFVAFLLTIGLSWLLYPAWVAFAASKIEWTGMSLGGGRDNNGSSSSMMPMLSLIIPAYNEEDRISIFLEQAHRYLLSDRGQQLLKRLQAGSAGRTELASAKIQRKITVEWIVVNDGSKDTTCHVVQATHKKLFFASHHQRQGTCHHVWKIVNLTVNSGKGAAVKTGMNIAHGEYRLMVDADGATDFGPGLESLVDQILSHKNNEGDRKLVAVFGSRAHLQDTKNKPTKETSSIPAGVQRSLLRTLLMHAFHFFVSSLVSTKIKDTQCGFKLFTAQSSRRIFQTLHLKRWAFDTEIVLLCDKQAIRIIECPVPWHEVDGSKLSTSKLALAWVSITMLRDMICVRACYTFGIWQVNNTLTQPVE